MKKKVNVKERNRNWKGKKLFFFISLVIFVFILDRYTKLLSSLSSGLDNCFFIFCIKPSVNYGAAFSLLSGFAWTRVFLIIIALFVLFFTAFVYFQKRLKFKKFNYLNLGLILLFAGTLCNLIDRIVYGFIIDFITFSFWNFPAFNLADVSNVAGVVLLIIFLIKQQK